MTGTIFGKSIKTQLIVLLFGLTAVCIGVAGFVGVRAVLSSGGKDEKITSDAMRERAEEFLVQTTNATASKNSVIFQNVQRSTFNASKYVQGLLENPQYFPNTHWRYDPNIFKLPTGQYSNNDKELGSVFVSTAVPITANMKKVMELTSYMDYYVPQTLKDEPNAVAMYYINGDGAARYYPNIGLAALSTPDFKPQAEEFFTVAAPQNNPDKTAQWTSVYDDPAGKGLTITASHPVFASSKFVGVIGIDVTLVNIAKNVEDYSPIESSYAFLMDSSGRAIALPEQGYEDILGRAQKKDEFGPDLSKAGGTFKTVLADMRQSKDGFLDAVTANTDVYVAYAPVEGTPFSLAIVARADVLLKAVTDLREQAQDTTRHVLAYQLLPFTVAILIFVWIAGFFYIRFLTGPIIALTEKADKIAEGGPEQAIAVRASNNEVGRLAKAFNKMTRELAESYKALENKVVEVGNAKAKDDAILNSIGDGVVVTDKSGDVLLVNGIAADLFGVNQEGFIGKPIIKHDLYDNKMVLIPEKQRPVQRAMASSKKVNRDVMLMDKHGAKSAINITATPVIQDGAVIGAIQIVRDVTKEKEIDRMKTEFISIASHQLRTPLSAIKWFGEILMSKDMPKLTDDQAEYIHNISASTDRMIELVNSLLNISRIESGRIMVQPSPTNLKELVSNIIDDLKGKTSERKQKMSIKVDTKLPKIELDPRLIGQVYMNILTNAIKYTPKGGSIKVMITQKGNEVISQITDTGYGIPKAEQSKVFQKFYRGTNIIQIETDGTGLGMYLTKSIIESSDGKIWFESEEKKGTTFWFSLPISGMKAKDGEVTLD